MRHAAGDGTVTAGSRGGTNGNRDNTRSKYACADVEKRERPSDMTDNCLPQNDKSLIEANLGNNGGDIAFESLSGALAWR